MARFLVTAIYIPVSVVIYYFCRSYVTSPALGSAGATMKKIAYGFALPALVITTAALVHVGFVPENTVLFKRQVSFSCRVNRHSFGS